MPFNLSMGTMKVDITPKEPVQLAGFANRQGAVFEELESKLYARLFYLRGQLPEKAEQQALIVVADLLNWEDGLVERLRKRISNEHGIPEKSIVLHATHNHSGPAIMNGIDLGEPSDNYLQLLQNAVCEGVSEAIRNGEPVRIERGSGTCDLAWNRRNEELTDSELIVIRFATRNGNTKALWINYSCHPVLSNERIVSSEYCGNLTKRLESQLGNGATAAFLQGTCADIDPRLPSGKRGLEAVHEAGDMLYRSVVEVLEHRMSPVISEGLEMCHHEAKLPYADVPAEEELEVIKQSGSPLEQKWAAFMLQNPERMQPSSLLEIVTVKLSQQLSFLFMNGELSTSYGLAVKKRSGGLAIPVAYSHGFIGYVTTAAQLRAGGYEPCESVLYFGLPSPYDSSVESIVLESIWQGLECR